MPVVFWIALLGCGQTPDTAPPTATTEVTQSTTEVPPATPTTPPATDGLRSSSTGLTFVRIEPGSYTMGSPKTEEGRFPDETQHPAKVERAFLLATTELTQRQWRAVATRNPSRFAQCGDDCPVEGMSWFDAVQFCNYLSNLEKLAPAYQIKGTKVTFNDAANGYRLPTEIEWEWAARAGQKTIFAGSNDIEEVSWYYDNAGLTPHPVGQKKPNAWGLYDMSGNVYEWVFDEYTPYTATDPGQGGDPEGRDFRVLRGGSAGGPPRNARVAYRNGRLSDRNQDDVGIRLARNAD